MAVDEPSFDPLLATTTYTNNERAYASKEQKGESSIKGSRSILFGQPTSKNTLVLYILQVKVLRNTTLYIPKLLCALRLLALIKKCHPLLHKWERIFGI